MRRAYTLIELMIAIAILGVTGVILGNEAVVLRREAAEQLLRERATQVVEYEAEALVRGTQPNPNTVQTLLEQLPAGTTSVRPPQQGLAIASVDWKGANGKPQHLELAVLVRSR